MRFRQGIPARTQVVRSVICLIVVFPLALPAAHALAAPTLKGALEFGSATLHGMTAADTDHLDGAYLTSEATGRLNASWMLQAASGTAILTYKKWVGLGSRPNDSRESFLVHETGDASRPLPYEGEKITASVDSEDADLLVVPRPGSLAIIASVNGSRQRMEPTPGTPWAAGMMSASSVSPLGNDGHLLTKTFAPSRGNIVLGTEQPVTWTIQGDLDIYVWGGNVTIWKGADVSTYRTGMWRQNETGPLAREEHAALIHITVEGAALAVQHADGRAQWTARTASLRTQGAVEFAAASGSLTSPAQRYDLRNESATIQGTIQQALAAHDAGLRSSLEATDAEVNVAGVPIPSTPENRPVGVPWLVAGLLAAAAAIGGARWGLPRYRDATGWPAQVAKADEALARGYFRTAYRKSRSLVRKRPEDPGAWFLYGSSLYRLNQVARLLTEVGPVAERHSGFSPLPLLMALACADAGREGEAIDWLRRVENDDEARREIQGQARLRAVLRKGRARPRQGDIANAAYA